MLLWLFFDLFEGRSESWLPAATCIEMIHTYSLVHDDLPCMDDDEWRRGRPTTHRQFDEATALLVGDALLSDAFGMLATCQFPHSQDLAAAMKKLSQLVGGQGMVAGQSLDMHWTQAEHYRPEDLHEIHDLKTAALMTAAAIIGALLAGATPEQIEQVAEIARKIGLAFQIQDDLIDSLAGTGKSAGKDLAQGKLTYLRVMPAREAQNLVEKLTKEALSDLAAISSRNRKAIEFFNFLMDRKS